MKPFQPTIYEDARLTIEQSIEMTAESLRLYGRQHEHWALAWSGGKDSTALVTAVSHLIATGRVPAPKRLTVLYADTRMELPPLAFAARAVASQLRERGIDVRTVMAPLDQRFFVYMLGRGVPPPNNNTLRWCTAQIKVDPMEAELRQLATETPGKVLMLIGVRVGESAARDQRIAVACSRNGAECGQGWYQRDLPDALCSKLSPILHWRTCLVWDWLAGFAGKDCRHGFDTHILAEAYGQDAEHSAAEINARTGCVGCPLASKDVALDAVIHLPQWSYLSPLRGLKPIYRTLREARMRLRKPGGERRKDGTYSLNQNRMGPLTMKARLWALDEIVSIQSAVNAEARRTDRPQIDILNGEEESRIRELIAANTWPQKWTGEEPVADLPYEETYTDGTRQLLLAAMEGRDW